MIALYDDDDESAPVLLLIEEQIEERKPISPRLKVMTDPVLADWFAQPVWTFMPTALVQHWPFVFLTMYGTDLLLLLLIGRVPLAYNFRYLWVRRRDTIHAQSQSATRRNATRIFASE